jgi:hypothetical protein
LIDKHNCIWIATIDCFNKHLSIQNRGMYYHKSMFHKNSSKLL